MEPLSHHLDALRRDPSSESAAAQVRRASRAEGNLAALVTAFAERGRSLGGMGQGESAALAYLEAAMVAEEVLDWATAADLFRLAYQSDPKKRDALVLLGRALAKSGRPRELIPTLREMLRSAAEPSARAEIHVQLGAFMASELSDREAAVAELRAALAADPASIARVREAASQHGLGDALDGAALQPTPAPRPIGTPTPLPVVPGPALPISPQAANFRASMSGGGTPRGSAPPASPSQPTPAPRASAPLPGPSTVGTPRPSAPQITPVPRASAPLPGPAVAPRGSFVPQPPAPRASLAPRPSAPPPPKPLDENGLAILALAAKLKAAPADLAVIDELMRLGQLVEDPTPVVEAYEEAVRNLTDASLRSYVRTRLGALYNRSLDHAEDAVRVYAAILADEPRHPEARRMLVARDAAEPVSEARSQEQEEAMIAALEREAALAAKPADAPQPELPAPPPPVLPPPSARSASIPPRASIAPAAFARASAPPQKRGLVSTQTATGALLVVLVGAGAFLTFTDALWPELEITSRPAGASVIIDGEVQPETTPTAIRVKPGAPHQVELRYGGAEPKVIGRSITLDYLANAALTGTLEPKPRVARVTPVPARIELNGRLIATSTAATLRDFALDEPANVLFVADGYLPLQRSFDRGSDVPDEFVVELKPMPK